MPNLYNKLMAKDMPGAAPAPTSRQMVAAPMGLRSAMKRYAEGGDTPPPPPEEERIRSRLREEETMRPPEDPRTDPRPDPRTDPRPDPRTNPRPDPRYEEPRPEPRYEEPRPDPRPDPRPPEIYPQDYAGPRTTGTSQTQQVGPRTSYRQNADGSLTEIGYDGQPIAGYTPEQLAMHNATMGIDQPKFSYVWNGQGYTKVPAGAQTGYDPGTTTAYDPGTTTAPMPDYGQTTGPMPMPEIYPTTGPYREEPTSATMPMFPDTAPYPTTAPMPNYDIGYDQGVATKPNYEAPPEIYPQVAPQIGYNEDPRSDPRMEMLRKALSGQSASSLGNSQQLASLLQMLGYSK